LPEIQPRRDAACDFQKQSQPIAFALQCLFVHVALNRDPSDVAGILDQLEFVGTGPAWFTIVDRKCAESFAFAREQRA